MTRVTAAMVDGMSDAVQQSRPPQDRRSPLLYSSRDGVVTATVSDTVALFFRHFFQV